MIDKIIKSESEWQQSLSPDQYAVCRLRATEAPFSGKYTDTKDHGIYSCVACGQELFSSSTKFDSGSGWPSYFQPINKNSLVEITDTSHGMTRTEIQCSRCHSHLGHVFPDGPEPTGLRYCINSVALNFKKGA